MVPLYSVRMEDIDILSNAVKAKDVRGIKERHNWHYWQMMVQPTNLEKPQIIRT